MATQTTVIPLPPDLVHRDRVRRQALRVAGIHHDGLGILRGVDFISEGLALTWELPMGAAPLDVPAAAESMDATEVLRVLAPIAGGLALLHDAGLAHGAVRPSGILHVDGAGVLVGWLPGGTPADDVRDLTGLLERWLPSASVGADVAHLVIAGSDPDPQVRPSMARVAAALDRAASRSVPPTSPPAHRRSRVPEPEAPPEPSVSPRESASPRALRGRHAARHASAGRTRTSLGARSLPPRIPWRWAIAGAGALAAAFLGFTAVGSADVVCPVAPVDTAPATSTSRVDPATSMPRAITDPKRPAGSPTRSSDRSR